MVTAIVEQAVLEGEPVKPISCLPPDDPWDSGYAVWASEPD